MVPGRRTGIQQRSLNRRPGSARVACFVRVVTRAWRTQRARSTTSVVTSRPIGAVRERVPAYLRYRHRRPTIIDRYRCNHVTAVTNASIEANNTNLLPGGRPFCRFPTAARGGGGKRTFRNITSEVAATTAATAPNDILGPRWIRFKVKRYFRKRRRRNYQVYPSTRL